MPHRWLMEATSCTQDDDKSSCDAVGGRSRSFPQKRCNLPRKGFEMGVDSQKSVGFERRGAT